MSPRRGWNGVGRAFYSDDTPPGLRNLNQASRSLGRTATCPCHIGRSAAATKPLAAPKEIATLPPTAMSPHDEQEVQLVPPAASRVISRAFCLSAVTCRSFIEEHPTDEQCCSLHARILPWLTEVGAESELEPWEWAALSRPLGQLETQSRVNGSWTSEGLAVLGWALQRYDLPAHDECVDPQALTNALEFLQPTAAIAIRSTPLRSAAEIQSGADRALALHWRLRQFTLCRDRMDFANFVRTAWFGPLNIEGAALTESDLSIGGVPISRAAVDMVQTASSIAVERHKAFNWLLGYDEIYSEVDTST